MSTEPRDAAYWAKDGTTLRVGDVPAEAIDLDVTGRRVVGPVQGFGRMWQKTTWKAGTVDGATVVQLQALERTFDWTLGTPVRWLRRPLTRRRAGGS